MSWRCAKVPQAKQMRPNSGREAKQGCAATAVMLATVVVFAFDQEERRFGWLYFVVCPILILMILMGRDIWLRVRKIVIEPPPGEYVKEESRIWGGILFRAFFGLIWLCAFFAGPFALNVLSFGVWLLLMVCASVLFWVSAQIRMGERKPMDPPEFSATSEGLEDPLA
jgi:hypothetical protein